MEYTLSPDAENTDAWNFRDEEEAQATESAFAQAVSMVESGQAIQQVLDGMDLPDHLKQKLLKRLQQAVQEKQVREHEMARQTREKTAKGAGKLFSMSMIAGVISKETLEKIQRVFAPQTSLGNAVKEQGHRLLKNGAEPDLEFSRGQQQAVSAPSAGIAQNKQKELNR